jgi:hypothetical protein
VPSKLLAKRIITWLAFILGLLICVYGFALFGALPAAPYFYVDNWAVLLGAVFMGLAPLVASFFVMRNRRAVLFSYLVGAVIEAACAIWIWLSKDEWLFASPGLNAGICGLFILLSIFWYISQRHNWPYLFAPGHPSWWRKSAAIITGLLMLLIISLGSIKLGVNRGSPTCSGPPPFARPMAADQAVFTAEVRGISAWPLRMIGIDYLPYGIVKEHFWGLHWWERKFVLLTLPLHQNVIFFIDGRAMSGFLTRFLPVVELMPCTRTKPLDQATEDMRVLHNGPPRTGVRIIGTVIHTHSKPNAPREAMGMEVTITGPTGPIKIKTDKQGIYDVSGLPPGAYSAVVTEEGAILRGDNNCRTYPDQDLKSGDIWGCRLLIR